MRIIATLVFLAGCSNPTETPESVAKHFIGSVNSGNVDALAAITPNEFWAGLVHECAAIKTCDPSDLFCPLDAYDNKTEHEECTVPKVKEEWKEFVQILHEEFTPCNYLNVKWADKVWDLKARAFIECDGTRDIVLLAQAKDGSWYLSGYFEGRLISLRKKVTLEQMARLSK